ncbi:MAG: glycosyltransferase family 1 protein [Candidatus Daviesbacteria bacterium]|nr:glycosyltransferase family 1 protein [Candidatus Daviesbacteria bacterium]
MKNIWIDGYEANVPQRLGSSQVAFELLSALEQIDQKNNYTILLPNKPLDDLPKERDGWKYKVLKPGKLWTYFALPLALFFSKDKPDLFFSPTHYIPKFTKIKRVGTIFDLAYLKFPELFKKDDLWKLKNWTKYSVLNASHLITISDFSKKDIVLNYQIPSSRITVAYPGYDQDQFKVINDQNEINNRKEKYNIEGDYLLFIGTIQPRKNLIKLIEAWHQVISSEGELKNKKLQLVIVGKTTGEGRQAWMYEDILNRPKELGIDSSVNFTGFVPIEDLPYLINGATAFILPSLWEGFGIPVVESMACGTPVIVSNVSSLPEVVGDAGILIDPYSTDEMAQAIRTILADHTLQSKKSKEGKAQAQKFSWEKMAKTVLRVFEELG